jgi:pSer/pThr/pTyr-binding forkhead associated (FHA) protein
MKVNLVVAQGVHAGKVIPVQSQQFLIGRDAHCNLRPASASVSKQHCGIFLRDGKVFVQDYGSTNGTCINGEQIVGEREVDNDDKLKIGPLEFVIRVDKTAPESTVLSSAPKAKNASSAAKSAAAATTVAPPAATAPPPAHPADVDGDQAAAMLMAMEDGSDTPTAEAQVPEGSTVMDIPAMPEGPDGKPPAKPAAPANTAKTAADILSKYMRRPRT